jgi:2-dehydropantoate 2-reductase
MQEEMIYQDTGFAAGRTVTTAGATGRTGRRSGPPPRVAVVGAGAVGGYLAARAADAGADVTVYARRTFDRLRVVHVGTVGPHGGDLVTEHTARVVSLPEQLEQRSPFERRSPFEQFEQFEQPADWVLLATKAHQTVAALPWLVPLVGPRTIVIVAQNGVRHVERVSPPVPAEQVLPAVVYINAELVAPGTVHHHAYGFIQLPDVEAAERFARTVLTGEGEVRLVSDFATASWTKLAANSAANSLTALTLRRLEVIRRDDVADVALALAREAVAVARADGANIVDNLPELIVQRLRGLPPDAATSMYYDRLASRPLEHDALLGAVVRIGAEYGVPTPVSRLILALLSASSEASSDQASRREASSDQASRREASSDRAPSGRGIGNG